MAGEPPGTLGRVAFVGREEELKRLVAALEPAKEGKGGLLRVVGPAGIGKTRLLDEFERAAREEGMLVARVAGELDRDGPLSVVDRLWSMAYSTAHAEPDPASGHAPSAPPPPPVHPPAGAHVPAEPTPVRPWITRLWSYLEGWRAPADEAVRVLIVDDAEVLGDESREGLEAIARLAPTSRLLLVLALREATDRPAPSGRDGEGPEGPSDAPSEPPAAEDPDLLPLGPLSRLQRKELAELALGDSIAVGSSEQIMVDLLERSGGEPLTVLELAAYLDAEGWVSRSPEGVVVRAPEAGVVADPAKEKPSFPVDLTFFLARRLARLTPSERTLLSAAALQGPSGDVEELAAAVGATPMEVTHELEVLDASNLLDRAYGGGGGRWEFPNRPFREAAKEASNAAERQGVLRRWAAWRLEHRPEPVFRLAEVLHEGSLLGPDPPVLVRAFERAIEERSWGWAERLLGWMLDVWGASGEPTPEQAAEVFGLLQWLRMEADESPGLGVLRRLAKLSLADPLRVQVEADRAAAEFPSDPEVWAKRFEEARGRLPEDPRKVPMAVRVSVDRALLDVFFQNRQFEEGANLAAELLRFLGPQGDVRTRLDLLDKQGWCLMGLAHRWREAGPVFQTGAALSRRSGFVDLEAAHVSGEAFVHAQLGESREAAGLFERAAKLSEEAGDLPALGMLRAHLAEVLALEQRNSEAERVVAVGLRATEFLDLPTARISLLRVEGELHAARGDWKEARDSYEHCLLVGGARGNAGVVGQLRLLALRARGELGEARPALEELHRRFTDMDPKEEVETVVVRWRTQARLEELTGDRKGAANSRREAEKVLLQRREELRPGDRLVLDLLSPASRPLPLPPPPPPPAAAA